MAHWPSTTRWDLSAERWPNEGDLVTAARNGDKQAFQRLIFRYDRLVLTLGLHVTGSEDAAGRIYERVFVTAFGSLPAANVEASFFVWIYRIAAQCCQEYLQNESEQSSKRSHWHLTGAQKLSADEATPTNTEALLSRLSVRERLVFVLAHYSRLRIPTIAVVLKTPESSVKDALARAFYKLRTEKAARVAEATSRTIAIQCPTWNVMSHHSRQ